MKQGSYRIRWENITTKNVEEARIDVERKDIYVESDLLSDSIYYRIHFDMDWQLDDFEVMVDGTLMFRFQRKMNGMWVDRNSKKVYEEFKDFQFFNLSFTPMTHIMATKRLNLLVGEAQTVDVALFDIELGKFKPVKQTYTRINDTSFRFHDGISERIITINEEGMIVSEEGRFRMLDWQIW